MQTIMKYACIFISFQFIFGNPKKGKQRDIFTEVITWVSLFQRCDYTMHFTIQRNDANGLPEVHFEDLVQLQIGVMRGYYRCVFVEVSKNVDKNDLIWLVRRRFHREQNRVPTILGVSMTSVDDFANAFVEFANIDDAFLARDLLDREFFKGKEINTRRDKDGFREHFCNLMNEKRSQPTNQT